jgi:ribose 5-phosphate isomerase RpiB
MMGFITITRYLNNDVAVRVAATEINAVVAAVVMIVVVGIGTSISVNGISTICASAGSLTTGVEAFLVSFVGCLSSCGGSSSCSMP